MPVELKDLVLKAERKLTVPLGDDASIVFWWSPTKYTREIHALLTSVTEEAEKDPFEFAEKGIVPLVTRWDITVDGKPWPITAANVAKLGLFICVEMTLAIVAEMKNYGSKKDSDAGSLTPV